MESIKFKIVIFIILIISLIVTLFYGIFGFSLSYLSEDEIKIERTNKQDLINSFKINNIDTVFDKENNIYFYTIPDTYEKNKYTLKLDLDEGYKYKILGYATNIITVDYNKEYNIIIYNDEYYYETKLVLTNLPLISIKTDTDITDNETNSIFKYINPYNFDEIITYNSKIHIRGATSRRYNKKSYKIDIYDKDYDNEKNINISNFYYGSSFILDAIFRDNSKIRNVFSTDIWNLVSDDFTNVDVYSEYVEVFINDKYMGLYSFMEPVNRKNLNLSKSGVNDTSVIIKAAEATVPKSNSSFSNITDDTYLNYELKYPNDKELFSESWNKILTKLSKYYNSSSTHSKTTLSEIFDLNNYIDMLIFNTFINNTDNKLKKNNYFYIKTLSSKVNIQPWDMEFSFGLKYSEEAKYNFEKDLSDYDDIDFDISDKELKKLSSLIVNRYWNLRRSVLSIEYLDNMLDNYKNKLNKGAAKRDSSIWLEYDIEKEIEEIRAWLKNRIKVYDNVIRGLENE